MYRNCLYSGAISLSGGCALTELPLIEQPGDILSPRYVHPTFGYRTFCPCDISIVCLHIIRTIRHQNGAIRHKRDILSLSNDGQSTTVTFLHAVSSFVLILNVKLQARRVFFLQLIYFLQI
jgi:hypothetical protein